MKKAKQYQQEYESVSDYNARVEKLKDITVEMLMEVSELMKIRKARSNAAIFSIFTEINQKWKAFSNCDNAINRNGFEDSLKAVYPEAYFHWKLQR